MEMPACEDEPVVFDVHLVDRRYELFRYQYAPNNRDATLGAVDEFEWTGPTDAFAVIAERSSGPSSSPVPERSPPTAHTDSYHDVGRQDEPACRLSRSRS
jgi:hypothetical protein